jgi:hypothetical protein
VIKKSKERLIVEALERIFGRTTKAIITDGKIIEWLEPSEVQPSNDQIQEIVDQIIAEEPMNLLRRERGSRLSQSDWRVTPDYSSLDQPAWILYRQTLRELPQQISEGNISSPTIDENGDLVFEHWPLEPN